MQNFEPESAVISASSNFALIEKYLRNTCLGQGAIPTSPPYLFYIIFLLPPHHSTTNKRSSRGFIYRRYPLQQYIYIISLT